jgi:excisionase family DNA binding protein
MEEALKGFLSTEKASERVGIHRSQIRRLLESGKVKGTKVGRDWLVDAESLDHYAATQGWFRARRRKARKTK